MSENPEIKLKDANANPWYVLATVFGEQGGEIDKMAGWVQVFSAGQTMASFALLFFLALALRNRFRLT